MNSINRLWVLGAGDPEMAAIERLLTDAGERVAYASIGVDRVHPGNAYRFTSPLLAACNSECVPILVECAPAPANKGSWLTPISVDHHRPGDPGYGGHPEDFVHSSSIGQVFHLLHATGDTSRFTLFSSGWTLENRERDASGDSLLHTVDVPAEYVLCAAADHCLEAAYRGKCPGVDPDALMQWRAESRAAFQGRSVESVLADVQAARRALHAAPYMVECGVCGVWGGPDLIGRTPGDSPEVWCNVCCADSSSVEDGGWLADLRGQSVPELPEAAAREGIPFLSTVKDRDGREKVVLMAAPPKLVQRFLAGELVPGLKDHYGDPARGFAGGYA